VWLYCSFEGPVEVLEETSRGEVTKLLSPATSPLESEVRAFWAVVVAVQTPATIDERAAGRVRN